MCHCHCGCRTACCRCCHRSCCRVSAAPAPACHWALLPQREGAPWPTCNDSSQATCTSDGCVRMWGTPGSKHRGSMRCHPASPPCLEPSPNEPGAPVHGGCKHKPPLGDSHHHPAPQTSEGCTQQLLPPVVRRCLLSGSGAAAAQQVGLPPRQACLQARPACVCCRVHLLQQHNNAGCDASRETQQHANMLLLHRLRETKHSQSPAATAAPPPAAAMCAA